MRKWISLVLLCCLPLTGCDAMLDREFVSVTQHPQTVTTVENPSTLQAQNYQELLSAILYLVARHAESGTVRLFNYTQESGSPAGQEAVAADLTEACLEVVQKDPLGAYAVDYIKHDVTRIVSYYEAKITISYQRTQEEMGKIVSVTGNGAIRDELRETFSRFAPQSTLRISYFDEDISYIHQLVTQAYYRTPQSAFGLPQVTMTLYPDSGFQRIVELHLSYPLPMEELLARQEAVLDRVNTLIPHGASVTAQSVYDLLRSQVEWTQETGFSTPYAALIEGKADGEGMALTYQLLCDRASIPCTVVQGAEGSEVAFWNIVTTEEGSRHVDCTRQDRFGLTDLQLTALGGYLWDNSYPLCRDGREMQILS